MVESRQQTRSDNKNKFSKAFFADGQPRFDVTVAGKSHVGKVRSRNEDHFAVFRRTRSCELLLSNLQEDDIRFDEDESYGILVADGIGGARFGDYASKLAVETVLQASAAATSWVMRFSDVDMQQFRERAGAYVDRVQEEFRKAGIVNPDTQQMGTTLTSVYLLPPHAIIVQVGDSRAYVYRDGQLTQITRDHTLAQQMIDDGLDAGGAKQFRNVLVNSLGVGRENVDADVSHVELQANDRLLICTDGLSDLVAADKISLALSNGETQVVCDRLVEMALEEGGRDNITVVVCDLASMAESGNL